MVESESMTNKSETEALGKYLTSEELWLRDVQRERGGRVYIETLGERMVSTLVVAIQGGDEATVNRGMASFDMIFGMACEYALEIKDEAVMLRSFLRGIGDIMLAVHLWAAVDEGSNWAIGYLQKQTAKIESIEEVHLRKFMGGIKNELIRRGLLESSEGRPAQ